MLVKAILQVSHQLSLDKKYLFSFMRPPSLIGFRSSPLAMFVEGDSHNSIQDFQAIKLDHEFHFVLANNPFQSMGTRTVKNVLLFILPQLIDRVFHLGPFIKGFVLAHSLDSDEIFSHFCQIWMQRNIF